jgi:hypothetical protein
MRSVAQTANQHTAGLRQQLGVNSTAVLRLPPPWISLTAARARTLRRHTADCCCCRPHHTTPCPASAYLPPPTPTLPHLAAAAAAAPGPHPPATCCVCAQQYAHTRAGAAAARLLHAAAAAPPLPLLPQTAFWRCSASRTPQDACRVAGCWRRRLPPFSGCCCCCCRLRSTSCARWRGRSHRTRSAAGRQAGSRDSRGQQQGRMHTSQRAATTSRGHTHSQTATKSDHTNPPLQSTFAGRC